MLTVPGNSLVLGDKVPIAVHEQAVQYLAFYAFSCTRIVSQMNVGHSAMTPKMFVLFNNL